MENKLWEVFEDRTKSLLERWSKFQKTHPGDDKKIIKLFLLEINDEFTQGLIKE